MRSKCGPVLAAIMFGTAWLIGLWLILNLNVGRGYKQADIVVFSIIILGLMVWSMDVTIGKESPIDGVQAVEWLDTIVKIAGEHRESAEVNRMTVKMTSLQSELEQANSRIEDNSIQHFNEKNKLTGFLTDELQRAASERKEMLSRLEPAEAEVGDLRQSHKLLTDKLDRAETAMVKKVKAGSIVTSLCLVCDTSWPEGGQPKHTQGCYFTAAKPVEQL